MRVTDMEARDIVLVRIEATDRLDAAATEIIEESVEGVEAEEDGTVLAESRILALPEMQFEPSATDNEIFAALVADLESQPSGIEVARLLEIE